MDSLISAKCRMWRSNKSRNFDDTSSKFIVKLAWKSIAERKILNLFNGLC